jgi:hypothetical protein
MYIHTMMLNITEKTVIELNHPHKQASSCEGPMNI